MTYRFVGLYFDLLSDLCVAKLSVFPKFLPQPAIIFTGKKPRNSRVAFLVVAEVDNYSSDDAIQVMVGQGGGWGVSCRDIKCWSIGDNGVGYGDKFGTA